MAHQAAAFSSYLQCRDRAGRLALLTAMAAGGTIMPLSLAEDLLCLDLGMDEKLAILDVAGSRDTRAFEHFLTENLGGWAQDLAALAVRIWAERTDHLLWFRVLALLNKSHVPQRVFYTIIDHAFAVGGSRLVAAAAAVEGIEEMSPALHGLLLHRALQWDIKTDRLSGLARIGLTELATHLHPDYKALPSSLAYLARFHWEELVEVCAKGQVAEPWRDLIRVMLAQAETAERQVGIIAKLVQKPPKKEFQARLMRVWPPLWQRHLISADLLAQTFSALSQGKAQGAALPFSPVSHAWEIFAGIPETILVSALSQVADEKAYAESVSWVAGLVTLPASEDFVQQLRTRLAAAADPATVLGILPLRLRLELTESAKPALGKPTAFQQVKQEESAMLAGTTPTQRAVFKDHDQEDQAALAGRKRFFDIAYRGSKEQAAPANSDPFFALLTDAWVSPTEPKLAQLAQAARQVEGVMRLCYLNTLGRFQGHDQAALKILDFIRSKEEDDLRAVLNALGGIGTPRATQELVSALTRPNITPTLQLEACGVLNRLDLTNLQAELRSAFGDLAGKTEIVRGDWEVREAISDLLAPQTANGEPVMTVPQGAQVIMSDQVLDQALGGKIAHYRELSSEVKRALRTSQFFHMQVSGDGAPGSIDLSPVVDMQYKALELLFREVFEEPTSRLINRGILQRRLDVIGYARPVPRAMDDFEAYVAALPVVRDIPFFSKFKLRKMLRAICQFRPGKRFTLDGLKAFALFFLCFSRAECRYGLAGLFPMGFKSDADLFEFVKALHIHQDVRNRAAHEGFHPDASSDIDGIWRATAEIVQTLFKTRGQSDSAAAAQEAPRSRAPTIIEKKVS